MNKFNVPDSKWNNLSNDDQKLYNQIYEQANNDRSSFLQDLNLGSMNPNDVKSLVDAAIQGTALIAVQMFRNAS